MTTLIETTCLGCGLSMAEMTVFDVALAGSPQEHIDASQAWAKQTWAAWSSCHAEVADLVARYLDR